MTKRQNVQAIEQATGRPWVEWESWLNSKGAKELPHKQIAELVNEELVRVSRDSPGWWAQGITVAYEQAIGRRAPGQRSDGTFEVSVSKAANKDREALFAAVTGALDSAREFDSQTIDDVRTSITPIRSYWKCHLADGSKVAIAIESKGADKSLLVVTNAGLASAAVAATRKQYWRDYIDAILP